MKCAILTTDTIHHRYFVSRISRIAQTQTYIERKKLNRAKLYWNWVKKEKTIQSVLNNPYYPDYHPFFEKKQHTFERPIFGKDLVPEVESIFTNNSFYDINEDECVNSINSFRPDIIISFGTGKIRAGILNQNCLKINIHRGILPKYRGLDSDLWACYFKDFNNIGTTIHTLYNDFDTGDIVRQQRIQIKPLIEVHHIRYYTTVAAAQMVENIIQEFAGKKSVAPYPQDLTKGTYYSYIPPIKRLIAMTNFNEYIRCFSS